MNGGTNRDGAKRVPLLSWRSHFVNCPNGFRDLAKIANYLSTPPKAIFGQSLETMDSKSVSDCINIGVEQQWEILLLEVSIYLGDEDPHLTHIVLRNRVA